MTPQLRSRKYLQARGWTVATVEQLKRFPDKRKPACRYCGAQAMVMVRSDLFGFGDILAFNGTNTLIVQATDSTNVSKRWRKIQESDEARKWLNSEAGRNIVVHGWAKKNNRWAVREIWFEESDFDTTRMAKIQPEEELLPF